MTTSPEVLAGIAKTVNENPVVLFMKGTPAQPMCGFSAQVIQILDSYGVNYHAVDVLSDWDIREGIKEFTNWPTIPQLYVKGQFVGGCDITMDLHRKGQLQAVLQS
jgi:monothiol glutaredoxin